MEKHHVRKPSFMAAWQIRLKSIHDFEPLPFDCGCISRGVPSTAKIFWCIAFKPSPHPVMLLPSAFHSREAFKRPSSFVNP